MNGQPTGFSPFELREVDVPGSPLASPIGGRASGVAVGRGPFAVVLAQWEGGPRTPGPNVATWRSVTLVRP